MRRITQDHRSAGAQSAIDAPVVPRRPTRRPGDLEILSALPDAVVLVDAAARVTHANPRALRLLGATQSDLAGRAARDVLPLRDELDRDWWDVVDPWHGLAIRTGHRERCLQLRGHGPVLVSMSFVRPGRSKPVSTVAVVLRSSRTASVAERAASAPSDAELIAVVAHELRGPLAGVRGLSASLLTRWERFTAPERVAMLTAIEHDAHRLAGLVQELLDVSRLDTARLRVHPGVVEVGPLLHDQVGRCVAAGFDPGRFRVNVPAAMPVLVWADRARLEQIVGNLLDNALVHGGGRVTVTAGYDVRGSVILDVADEGDGVPVADREAVFEKFWHGSHHESTGLGLYLVRGLVEAHQGTVRVARAPGGGAAFRVVLPSPPLPTS